MSNPDESAEADADPSETQELELRDIEIALGASRPASGSASSLEFAEAERKHERGVRRDGLRKWIAIGVGIHLVALEVMMIIALRNDAAELSKQLDVFATGASALTGVVLGFYFGQSSDTD